MQRLQPRYLCIGGPVLSRTDFQRHHVSCAVLPQLYRVDRRLCILAIDDDDADMRTLGMRRDQLIVLRPDPTGRYQLP